ncbi:unnamed protein product [Prorocentrum cordatum]|uniref:Uncharacterized protein n=1 Tax=Prorocentrum cordatum TaxID=2364126 RepID=A0ABN9QED3_9DINO|nr:unnamed protein product [Polarella glacialis]
MRVLACFVMPWTTSLSLLQYNPLCCRQDRLSEIITEGSNFDVIALTGTQRKRNGVEVTQGRSEDAQYVDAGWGDTQYSNKSAGILVAWRGYLSGALLVDIEEPHGDLLGRGLCVTLKMPQHYVKIIAIYCPPQPKTSASRREYHHIVKQLG